jgi:arginyl-tRNA synthetase
MTIKQEISAKLNDILRELNIVFDVDSVNVQFQDNPKFGDYSTNAALIAAKKLGKSPMELAEEIAQGLSLHTDGVKLFDRVEVVKPGFINFWISNSAFTEKLLNNLENGFESLSAKKDKIVIVEYSSPNIAKPFTIGHMRSTIIGDAIANLLQVTGLEVCRDNHVGDWGTQFGKQIYAIKNWGNEEAIEKSERPVKLLVELYVRFHEEAEKNPELEDKAREWFRKLEDGDDEARRLWQKCIEWSWKEFDEIYAELGVTFTENNGRGYGESYFEDKMDVVIKELSEKGILKIGKEGAKIVEFDEGTKLPPLMIVKKDGATLYATRDLATDKFRMEKYGKDISIINEVGAEQELYFKQLYKLERMLGWFDSSQRIHIKHGLIRFKEGKMSTRKGNTIWLEDVLEEARKRAYGLTQSQGKTQSVVLASKHPDSIVEHGLWDGEVPTKEVVEEKQSKLAKAVGIGAIKWNDLKRDAKQEILFDWDEALNMQGNSGPYIQYVFTRTQSVLEKAGAGDLRFKIEDLPAGKAGLRLEPEEHELLRLLSIFDEVIEEAAGRFAPHILCTYLFELAQAFNLFYQKHQILKADSGVRDFRLFITRSTGKIIKKGLKILGIQAPVKM